MMTIKKSLNFLRDFLLKFEFIQESRKQSFP